MGNNIQYKEFYTGVTEEKVLDLRQNYTILDVDYLDPRLVLYQMNKQESDSSSRRECVNKMLDFYMNHENKDIYTPLNNKNGTFFYCSTKLSVLL